MNHIRIIVLIMFAALAGPSAPARPQPAGAAAPQRLGGDCPGYDASLEFAPHQPVVYAGDTVTYTARLTNLEECPDNPGWPTMGLFDYYTTIPSASGPDILTPEPPVSIEVSGGLRPGEHHEVQIVFTAANSGTIALRTRASYEVSHSTGGPHYWGYRQTTAPVLTVLERPTTATYLPLLGN